MKIDAAGVVHWNGQLPDGTKVSQAVPLSADRTWPLFLSLYVNKGVMLGRVTHAAGGFDAPQLDWFKPAVTLDKYFTNGFSIDNTQMHGSDYTPPAAGNRVLNGFANTVPNGVLGLEDGNLLLPIPKDVTLGLDNKVTVLVPGDDKLSISINPTLGTFTGRFVHPVSFKTTAISGVMFQKDSKAYGFFPGTSVANVDLQTGRVTLQSK
jgi:hypothetical protein